MRLLINQVEIGRVAREPPKSFYKYAFADGSRNPAVGSTSVSRD